MTMKMRTILVDDVELARERIKMMLDESAIEVVAECENGHDAVEAIMNLKPDLVFLDVQMPEMDGFEVVETVGVDNMPPTVFVTAYDKFAVRAFNVNAVDYLVKPFDKERLTKAVERARQQIEKQFPADLKERLMSLLHEMRPETKYIKLIPIKSVRGTTLLPIEKVDWISAAGRYVELHVGSEVHLIRRQMVQLEQKLDPENFVRIHRSNIVNIERIMSFHPLFNGDHSLILRDGTELNMSRTYYGNLISLLER